jgi:membrane fusion protein, copper/silver efflux system
MAMKIHIRWWGWVCWWGWVWLLLSAGCDTGRTKEKQAAAQSAAAQSAEIYTCSMHPQILENHPGNCPICGMVLVKKNSATASINNIALDAVLKPTNESVISSLALTHPERKTMAMPVTTYGTIEYDTRTAGTISARVAGRIEKMYIRYRYQEVRKGQKIMDIYSSELLTAEQNLIFLLQNDGANASFIKAAKERLLLLGMGEAELQQVIRTGKPNYAIGIYSQYSGHVHEAGMMQNGLPQTAENTNAAPVTQELSLKEGMYIQKGQTLLMIMDHHMVWAALQVYPSDQSLVRVGNTVRIIPEADTTAAIDGRIDFIEPFFRAGNNTLSARVYFHNMEMLPVGSHVSATIYSSKRNGLWLPQGSVLSLGMTQVVFRKTEGGFTAHAVTTGTRSGTDVEILTGLTEDDSVAVNAQYFADSESFIKSSK